MNLREMARLEVPIVVAVIGEGGSGGALGIAVGDRILMMENAVYSVISPEGCAAILWKDPETSHQAAEEAAARMRITAPEHLANGLVDEIVPEPTGGAHADHDEAAAAILGARLQAALRSLEAVGPADRRRARYRKFRAMGNKGIEGLGAGQGAGPPIPLPARLDAEPWGEPDSREGGESDSGRSRGTLGRGR